MENKIENKMDTTMTDSTKLEQVQADIEYQEKLNWIIKLSYGIQNEHIIDKFDIFDKNNKELHENISFFETQSITKPMKQNYKQIFTFTDRTKVNSSYNKFIKNIRIKGLKQFDRITVEIGGQKIFRMDGFMCGVIAKRFCNSSVDNVIVPLDILPYSQVHEIKIIIDTGYETDKSHLIEDTFYEVNVYYDVYLYDMKKDPLKLVTTEEFVPLADDPPSKLEYEARNFREDNWQAPKYDQYLNEYEALKKSHNIFYENGLVRRMKTRHIIHQIQYSGGESYSKDSPLKIRLCFNHPINCIALNVPEETPVIFKFNGQNINIPQTYRVGKYGVYEFPYINFSRIDNASILIDDMSNMPEDENDKGYGTMHIFAFNVQVMTHAQGMVGLMYSK